MAPGFVFGLPELRAVLLATAIIATIAAIRYRSVTGVRDGSPRAAEPPSQRNPPEGRRGR